MLINETTDKPTNQSLSRLLLTRERQERLTQERTARCWKRWVAASSVACADDWERGWARGGKDERCGVKKKDDAL
jgi:hypothetical protein